MFKRMKVAFIIGAALILAGTSIFGGIMMKLNWDFTKLSTVKYISTEHNIDSPFKNIFITTNTASINIVPSVFL